MYNHHKSKLLVAFIFWGVLIQLIWGYAIAQIEKTEPLPGEPVAKFPKMIVGDRWVYDSHKGIRDRTVIEVKSDGSYIVEVKNKNGHTIAHLYYDNKYRLTKQINLSTGKIAKIPSPPVLRLNFPLFVGKKWTDSYLGWSTRNKYYNNKDSYIVKKIELVKTKAGVFKCYNIHRTIQRVEDSWRGFETYWYSPELKALIKSNPSWRKGFKLLSCQLEKADQETSSSEITSVDTKHSKMVEKSADERTKNTVKEISGKNLNIVKTRWAVIIGISQYKDTRIPSLRYAASDAQSFYNWLISPSGGQYAPARVKLLKNEQATGNRIKTSLFEWLGQVLEEDIVTIYFAGHGSPQSPDNPENLFLLPYDVQYDSIAATGFPMWDIETALKRFIKAKRVIVITDACHAGGVGQAFDVARRDSRGLKVVTISSKLHNLSHIGDGICIITASDDNQFSQESKKWGGGHGVFTYYLLKGLNGNADYNKDRSVSLGEIIPYLSEQVRRETKNAQTPTVAGRFDPALTIGK